ncbi:hypothetical protein BDV96DRAFT_565094 [Lophiotrema nucula]|uniref:Uncharacterized protein n=1 Tax=Lophiotrema nucula TaxID=690887 RepID=A0A6A5ZLU0_9PLEO|nr:hypothetical protein BDV96DRAFT_565094 [Lophiotrema nucula]
MADALCGPSNALQSFQKHSSVDRTLQQDRLTSRHSPAQNFRSSPGPNAGILDPEFEAFQAGHAGPPQPEFSHFQPHFSQPPSAQFVQAPQAPHWASDFQRLNITPTHAPPSQRPQQSQAANAAWHQDFMRQQSPAVQAPAIQQNTFGGMPSYAMGGFTGSSFQQYNPNMAMMNNPMSDVAQGKQQAQEAVPEFDEAAFERAFQQAERHALDEATAQVHDAAVQLSRPAETDPVLLRIQEKRLPVYTAIKLRSEIDRGRSAEALPWLQDLESLEKTGKLTENVSEAKWCVDALQKIVNREIPQEIQGRAETLIKAINERMMSTYPLATSTIPVTQENIWNDLEAAGYTTRTPIPEEVQQEPEQKQEEPKANDDDEMAETAGRLLERVADNTSEKFQNSQFLDLMRRLRDREVRVDGDKVVERFTGDSITLTPLTIATDDRIPVHEQDLDLGRSGVPGLDPAPIGFDPKAIREDEYLHF